MLLKWLNLKIKTNRPYVFLADEISSAFLCFKFHLVTQPFLSISSYLKIRLMKFFSRLFMVGFLSSILLVSCDVSDDGFFQTTQVSSILGANVPDTMVVGETYTLEITYQKDSNCHRFSNFESANQGDSLYFVQAITIFTETSNCNQEVTGEQQEVNFTNNFESDFTFKFLSDRDDEGETVYIDKPVVVKQE